MRYFLIDKVTDLEPGQRACGVKNVSLSDEILHDHFPDYPTMPGALIVEAASQLAGFLLEMSWNKPNVPLCRALLVQIDLAKFHEMAGPGDQLEIEVRMSEFRDTVAQISAEVRAGPRQIARTGLTFLMKAIDSERLHEQRRSLYRLWTRDFPTPLTIL